MINNDNIKELLERKKLQQILLIALSNSLKLKLSTTSKSQDKIVNIETKINLLKGLTTKISDKSLLFGDNNILKFHQKQVENAYETWEKNRETIIKLLQIIAGNSVEITSLIKESSEQSLTLATEENYIEDTSFDDDFTDFALDSTPENSLSDEENQQYVETKEDDGENWIDDIENDTEESVNDNGESENFDDMSLDLGMMTEEKEIFTAENKEEVVEAEEDWEDFIDEMPEEEEITTKEEVVINSVVENNSPSLEVDDDWQEWLEEDNSTNNNGEHEDQAIDWSEEDWQEEEEIS